MDEAEGLSFFLERQRKEEGQDGPFIHRSHLTGYAQGHGSHKIRPAASFLLKGAGQMLFMSQPLKK